jgi:chitodextrinase
MKTSLACCAVLVAFAVLAPAASAAGRDRTPPSVPTNVRVVGVTEDTITIAWNASTDNSGRIHAYIAGGIYHPGNSTTKTFTGLVPNWTQTYRVQAMDPSGNESALSAPVTATTAPDRWSFSYEVLMDGVVRESPSSTSTTLRTIAPGSTHTFQVRARDNSGNVSGVSNAVTVTLAPNADVTPPTAPSNLTVEDLNDNCGSQISAGRRRATTPTPRRRSSTSST